MVLTDLEHMLDYEIGMLTTILIGNAATTTYRDRMITPRGYRSKYEARLDAVAEGTFVAKRKVAGMTARITEGGEG